ncbi:SAM-dependent methyltransferase [Actinoalloteichus sp. AHMU CJ021]|nr:SAM-dependent methyltransferase [Actinoalloteichus sp. AHMU CJ021]
MYGRETSEVYDLFYQGRGQDFAGEASAVVRAIRERRPHASSLLDVACGTGQHLVSLKTHFDDVAGLELSPAMRDVARRKLPDVPINAGDMRDFDLGRSFDAVCCLTSSIAYMATVDELWLAVSAMARALVPGGVLVVDPGWFPETFLDGYVGHAVVHDEDRTVARLSRSHTVRNGRLARHEAHYLVPDRDGIRHFTHVQELALFTRGEYLSAFEQAGCRAEYLASGEGISARGLFVGVLR